MSVFSRPERLAECLLLWQSCVRTDVSSQSEKRVGELFLTASCVLSGKGTLKVTTVPEVGGAARATTMRIITPASTITQVRSGPYTADRWRGPVLSCAL